MDNGYIKIHRKLLNWYGFTSSKRVHLWITLLLKANHKENRFLFNGEPITVKRGSFITGRNKLSAETGISGGYIQKLLKEFESDGMLEQQTSNKSRLITILCWDKHQVKEQQKDNRETTERQQKDTNKNVKNVKNEKKGAKPSPKDFLKEIHSSPAYDHIDIKKELGKMDVWLLAHPGRQKTKKFIVKWLNRIEAPLKPEKRSYVR